MIATWAVGNDMGEMQAGARSAGHEQPGTRPKREPVPTIKSMQLELGCLRELSPFGHLGTDVRSELIGSGPYPGRAIRGQTLGDIRVLDRGENAFCSLATMGLGTLAPVMTPYH